MCWSGEASAVLAATGLVSTAYFYSKGESKALCGALAYFSLMEVLQAYTYTVIDECMNPSNQIATFLGYLHITFQPFFINAEPNPVPRVMLKDRSKSFAFPAWSSPMANAVASLMKRILKLS